MAYPRIPRHNRRKGWTGSFTAASSGAIVSTDGVIQQGSNVDAGSDIQTPNDAQNYQRQDTGASSGNVAEFRWYLGGKFATDPWVSAKVGPSDTTSVRMVVGLCGTTVANVLGSDTPSQSYAFFSFSSARGDTYWQFQTDNGSGTPEETVTTVVPTTSVTEPHRFEVEFHASGTVAIGRILNQAGEVLWQGSHSTKLPAASTVDARSAVGIETLTTASRYLHEWDGDCGLHSR